MATIQTPAKGYSGAGAKAAAALNSKHFDDLERRLRYERAVDRMPVHDRFGQTIVFGSPVAIRVRVPRRELRTGSTVALLIID